MGLAPARTGCPLRGGDDPCQVLGGHWTSASRIAAITWREHRELLLSAYGCTVCKGEGNVGLFGISDLYTPTRDGG